MEAKPLVIDDNLKQAEMRKEQRLLEIREKQRIREEKAKRIRERVCYSIGYCIFIAWNQLFHF